MTGTENCREIRQALGVYVLGAIDPAERAQVEEHLAICLGCREELASLAGLPSLLRRIPLEEAERLAADDSGGSADAPSESVLRSVLARASAVKRARRLRGLVAAAAVVVLAVGAGAAATSLVNNNSGGPPAPVGEHWQTVTAVYRSTGAHMIVKYAKMPWGTLMRVEVSGLKPGTPCDFQVTDYAGHSWTVGGWRYGPRGAHTWYPASTWIAEKNLRSFELTSGGKVLAVAPATD